MNLNNLSAIVLAGGDGNRVQSFLSALCGGTGVKQFCTITGSRSMLQQTIDRVQVLVSPERIFASLNSRHRRVATAQLTDLPEENLIFQPANLDTAPGILLPLARVSQRYPDSVVAVFPSDHFIRDEKTFVGYVAKAVREIEKHPNALVLLGVAPEGPDDGYGWIEAGIVQPGEESSEVRGFWEKPDAKQARRLMLQGSLWNTFVFVVRAELLWEMASLSVPELYCIFSTIRLMSDQDRNLIDFVYRVLRPVNFSSAILSRCISHLRVVRVPQVGWSDWGTKERILTSLQEIGKVDECSQRLKLSALENIQAS